MSREPATEDKPMNPVTVVVEEDETAKDNPGQLSDIRGELYLFHTDETLHSGKTYLVDLELTTAGIVRITDWWDETGYR